MSLYTVMRPAMASRITQLFVSTRYDFFYLTVNTCGLFRYLYFNYFSLQSTGGRSVYNLRILIVDSTGNRVSIPFFHEHIL